jgi:HEAT repeat protein
VKPPRASAVFAGVRTFLYAFTIVLTGLVLVSPFERGDGNKQKSAITDELRRDFRDPKTSTRRHAVRELSQLREREAWTMVIEALGDRESDVGDAAQLALARITDVELVRDLCGKTGLDHKDEHVGLRVAEALGRMAVDIDGELLVRRLTPQDPERTRYLIWSIERLARTRHLAGKPEYVVEALERIEHVRSDIEMSCAALVALGAVGTPKLSALVLDALTAQQAERRVAALLVANQEQMPECFAWSSRALADASGSVRMQAIENMQALATKPAMLALVARLGVEQRLRLRWRIVNALQSSSGLKNRLDPRPWQLWAEQLPTEGKLPKLSPNTGVEAKSDDGQTTKAGGFAGLSLISDHVCFLFDFSGSMWMPLEDGRLPKDIVDAKLREALAALPEDTQFNLVPFTNDTIPWEQRVQPAKQANVRKALDFFASCHARGRGNFYDAALFALADQGVDTIVALTDGVPTGGFHSDMDLIVPLFLERNRFTKVVVDSILVDAKLAVSRRWNDFSNATGGRCVEVDLAQ